MNYSREHYQMLSGCELLGSVLPRLNRLLYCSHGIFPIKTSGFSSWLAIIYDAHDSLRFSVAGTSKRVCTARISTMRL